MRFSLVVFGDEIYERILPFVATRYGLLNGDTALCYNGAYYDSLELLRQDFPNAQDNDIIIQDVYKECDTWIIGGEYSGRLKVLDDQLGRIFGPPKQGYSDQTTIENLNLSDMDFIPDAYLLKGEWYDTFVRYGPKSETPFPTYDINDWKQVLSTVPNDTLITVLECRR